MTPSSGLVVGCQSIGCIRSSNWDEGLNFHFLMTVQIMATPPTAAAMTIRTVMVVCFPVSLAGAAEDVAEAAEAAVLVTKTVPPPAPNEAEGRALTLRVGRADEVRAADEVVGTDEVEGVETETDCEVVTAEGEVEGAVTTGVEDIVLAGADEGAEEAEVWIPFPLDVPGSAAAPMTAGMPWG
jgi:hypothetical protein